MKLFSQRQGYRPEKLQIQTNDIDADLKNKLWNALDTIYWSEAHTDD